MFSRCGANFLKHISCTNVRFYSQRYQHVLAKEICSNTPKILITGGLGQLGLDCAGLLRKHYGSDNVILSDIVEPSKSVLNSGPFVYANILNVNQLDSIIKYHAIDWIIHFSTILSAIGEDNVPLSIKVNIEGLHNVMELSRQYKLKIFVPSSIGAFGPDSPRNLTPNITIQRPKTFYGVSKVHAELIGEYYHHKYGVDFRCLRFPGVVSCTHPGGGTTDYAVTMFHEAKLNGSYECYLKANTQLPMIYIDDCLRALFEFITAPNSILQRRVYNVTGMSFSPEELSKEIKNYFPEFQISYNPDCRQDIADTWPESIDDSEAQNDWLWKPKYDMKKLVEAMFQKLGNESNEKKSLVSYRLSY